MASQLSVVACVLFLLCLAATGFGLPAVSLSASNFNEASFRDLAEVVEGKSASRPSSILSTGRSAAELWEALLVAAAEQDVYTTANLALRRVAALKDQQPALFAKLTCIGSQVVKSDRLANPQLSYYIVDNGEQPPDGDSFLPAQLSIDASQCSSCAPSTVLHLPSRYETPIVSSSKRVLGAHEMDSSVAEYAKQVATDRTVPANWHVMKMEEQVTRVAFAVSEFVLGVVELTDHRYLIAVYRKSAAAPNLLAERRVQVTLADENANVYQIVVSSSSHPQKKGAPSFSVSKFSQVASSRSASGRARRKAAAPDTRRFMTYNIWNYNANWQQRKQMLAQFIHDQQPDLVGVQEIRYRYSGGPNQLTELADALLLLNQSYNYVYQPAMYYDTDAEGVGVLSRQPIIDHEYINLTFVNGTSDGNRRIVLRTLIQNQGDRNLFNFFASHFTYAMGEGQMSNAFELFNFMKRQRSDIPQAVVADFNIYVGHEEPTDFLTGKISYRGVKGDLTDLWEHAHGPDEPGYTFSNLPWSSGLINRADRMMVRNMPQIYTAPNSTVTTGQVKPGGDPASDHLAVSSLVSYTTNAV